MRVKSWLCVVLGVFSSGARAEWTLVERSGDLASYADLSSIQRNASLADLWVLFDNIDDTAGLTSSRSLSSTSRIECDCAARRYRYLLSSWHSDRMGGGTLNYTLDQVGRWQPVPRESLIDTLWQRACRQP